MKKIAIFVLLVGIALPANAEVYKWVDEGGVVHYGDSLPERQPSQAKRVDVKVPLLFGADSAPVSNGVARAPAKAAQTSVVVKPAEVTTNDPAAEQAKPYLAGKSACEDAWRLYNKSLDCFAPYVMVGGRLNAKAYEFCTSMAKPALCE